MSAAVSQCLDPAGARFDADTIHQRGDEFAAHDFWRTGQLRIPWTIL